MEALQKAKLTTPDMDEAEKKREERKNIWAQGRHKTLAAKDRQREESQQQGSKKRKKQNYPTTGICPECHAEQLIVKNPNFTEFTSEGFRRMTDPEDRHLMAEHQKHNSRCPGSGEIPEKLVWKK